MSENNAVQVPDEDISVVSPYPETQAMLNAKFGDKPLNPKDFGVKEEDVIKDKSFSTNGGVGVEARDVNADVNATIGVDKVDKSVTVGDNSTLTINNDNSRTVNKNRFDKAIGMQTPSGNTPQADAGLEK